MASWTDPLEGFERTLLERLLAALPDVHLSGGTALALHLGHRRSLDLDLFVTDAGAYRAAVASLPVVAGELGARTEVLRDAPAFRRLLVTGPGGQTVRVDLVLDTALRTGPPPVQLGAIRLDPPEELLVNKLCAILGRSEPRDLVDLYFLEQAGLRILDALPAAQAKDGGLTPAQLAWAIGQVPLDRGVEGLLIPVALSDLARFRDRLVASLERLAFPESPP